MDGIWVFIGAGGGIGALVGLALMAPAIVPRLLGDSATNRADPARLAATVSLYEHLDEAHRKRLQKQASRFLKHVKLSADTGQVPPILATAIAGNACLLRLHAGADCYPGLRQLHLGNTAPQVTHKRVDLNWSDVQNAMGGKRNPVVRAFAQILRDTPTGSPKHQSAAQYPEKWQRQFNAVRDEITIAESPVFKNFSHDEDADFFLSACEAYFQQGAKLSQQHPALYSLLHEYFGVPSAT